ncbi:MAG: polysaccharide pyruvyl transferase family protein [Polyangiales bacterium]
MTSAQAKTHILILNQHGENRGDEAAMRAMLARLEEAVPGPVHFTVLYQFRDRDIRLELPQDVQMLPIIMPISEAASLALFALFKKAGFELSALLLGKSKDIVAAYRAADLVLSAPGGPYFGDIYASHEIVHWFFVWLASLYAKRLGLYAPSAGPFRKRLLNLLRRRLYKTFDVLCSREEISADYIRELLGPGSDVHVTADSALQVRLPAMPREEYFTNGRAELAKRFVVAVSAIDYAYPGAADPADLRRRYEEAMISLLAHVARKRESHFLLVPQLHGRFHSDVPFLRELGARLPSDLSWEIVDDSLSSDDQRRIFGMADMFVASRYHPGIFASSAGVPGVCIYYEHKALGFMRQLELEELAFDIRDLDAAKLIEAADRVITEGDALRAHIETRLPRLVATARRTTDLVSAMITDEGRAA